MNPFVKKEVRLLLPAWIAAMLLAILPLSISVWTGWFTQAPYIGVPVGFIIGFLLLGIQSFGQEINSGTFAVLLSQPTERRRIWRIKMSVLALAFVSVLFVWAVPKEVYFVYKLLGHYAGTPPFPDFPFELEKHLILFVVTIFSGALWTTLLLRQIVAAFWLTLLVPLAIIYPASLILGHFNWSDDATDALTTGLLIVYSIAGFFYARWLFLRAQDTQWTGGQISFHWRAKGRQSRAIGVSGRRRHGFSALFWKEIHLHQANLLIAFILLVLNLAAAFILKIHPRFNDPDAAFMLQAVGMLWLLMPLIIGSAAIAEERRIGTLESQLCLPASRRGQLFVKCLAGLVLSLILGGAMQFLTPSILALNLWIFVAAAAVFFISFYASSFARTTIQAIGIAIAMCMILYLYEWGHIGSDRAPVGLQILKHYPCSPILLLTLCVLLFWNFNWLHESQKLWTRNAIFFFGAIACTFVLTHAIYYRAWELFESIQPPQGPARIASPSQVRLASSFSPFNTIYIVTPDHRLWTDSLVYDLVRYSDQEEWHVLDPARSRKVFIGGHDWADAAGDNFQAVGVQSNGTLWSIRRKWAPENGRWWPRGPFLEAKIGSDTDWQEAAGDSNGFLLLKKDGSLWTWGTNDYDWHHPDSIQKKLRLDLTQPPVHIGAGETFTRLFSCRREAYARETNGTVWCWTSEDTANSPHTLTSETDLDDQWASFAHTPGLPSILGVKTNGFLYFCANFGPSAPKSHYDQILLSNNARWQSAAFGPYHSLWAIRDDGALWQWPPDWELQLLNNQPRVKPMQLGTHTDWIAMAGGWAGLVLAADGSLWAWDEPSRHAWLAPSRKPVYMGNIFQAQESGNESPRNNTP